MKKNPFEDLLDVKTREFTQGFAAPTKEGATTGRFMSAGDNYGVGRKVPIGKDKASNKGPIPRGCKCFDPDEGIVN